MMIILTNLERITKVKTGYKKRYSVDEYLFLFNNDYFSIESTESL